MINKHFRVTSTHLSGCSVCLSASQNQLCSIGSDQILHLCTPSTDESKFISLLNQHKHEVTCIALIQSDILSYAVGTKGGLVMLCIGEDLEAGTIIYKCDSYIKDIFCSATKKYLLIVSPQQCAILYDLQAKRFQPLTEPHQALLCRAYLSTCDTYCCTLGSEGKLHVYLLHNTKEEIDSEDSDDPFADRRIKSATIKAELIDKYTIATPATMRGNQEIGGNFILVNPKEDNSQLDLMMIPNTPELIFLVGGQSTLQQVHLLRNTRISKYSLHVPVREQHEILQVCTIQDFGNNLAPVIVTTTKEMLSIWEYRKGEKLLAFYFAKQISGSISQLVRFDGSASPSFAFIVNSTCSDGNIYEFTDFALLSFRKQEIIEEEVSKPAETSPVKKVPQISIPARLVAQYPQLSLDKGYEQSNRSRFLYYNNVGCIIERTDNDGSSIELQLHDRNRLTRMQLDNKSYSYCYFALSEDNFVYASTTQVIFQNEKQLREGYSWSYNWENIQGVCISGHWVGVINKEEIKVFDIAGNQLHSICFDRKMVAIEAYENKLVVFYHCGVPVWGCQSLMMNVYCVTVSSSTFSHQCLLHLHPNSLLKWVGFSTEGMLFCQDTDEFVKSYNWETREWEVLLALDSQKEKLFIQHIENYNVYGFRVEQINGEHMEPTVMPRSLPRKIALDPPYIPIDFLLPEENVLISKLLLRIRILRHEQFRHDEWYQYKYSRGKDNINYAKSATIQTQQELDTARVHIDCQLQDYLKKLIARLKASLQPLSQHLYHQLIMLCDRIAQCSQTRQHLRMFIQQIYRGFLATPSHEMSFMYKTSRVPPSLSMISLKCLDIVPNIPSTN